MARLTDWGPAGGGPWYENEKTWLECETLATDRSCLGREPSRRLWKIQFHDREHSHQPAAAANPPAPALEPLQPGLPYSDSPVGGGTDHG